MCVSWFGADVCRIDADLCRSKKKPAAAPPIETPQGPLVQTGFALTCTGQHQCGTGRQLLHRQRNPSSHGSGMPQHVMATQSLAQMADTKTATGTDWHKQLLYSS